MNYFIGYHITGEAGEWHSNLTKKISEKFGTWKIHEKLPPHITIFSPFDTEDISSVKDFLRNFVADKSIPGSFLMLDYSHFDDRVVFAKVEVDKFVRKMVLDLRRILNEVHGMRDEPFSIWRPHATLANHLSPEEINKILEYVLTLKKPNFVVPFDNVTIFRWEGERRVVEESFSF